MKIRFCLGMLTSLIAMISLSSAQLPSGPDTETVDSDHTFRVHSSTFDNNATLPITAIHNLSVNGSNVCSIDGSAGGNESPELSWTRPRGDTRSFVVVLYDTTAAFTHWGMYNIPPNATGLPENAGVAGSKFGQQVINDFVLGAEYDGPCPPAGVSPFVHDYVFTVYALDILLQLPSSPNFPATGETLFQALIQAGRNHHILQSASITGLYSTTPPE
jgi:Raf kinase inhibitor-like YbhB/YbcL family protein